MPVQTISLPLTTSLGHDHNDHNNGGLCTRSFDIPRIKAAAAAFLRHGHLVPSFHQLKHHNKSILACNLPDEVAHKIFLMCVQLSMEELCWQYKAAGLQCEGGIAHGNPKSWSWFTITHVCSSWRLQALSYPLLWTYVDFRTPKYHTLTWARAKTSPLHVISPVTDHTAPLLYRTLQLAHRIKEIHLSSTSIRHIRHLAEILAVNPNPALESLILDVHIPSSTDKLHDKTNMDEIFYDPLLVPTAGPALRRLTYMELRGAPFYLLTPRCTFLTHFHLYDLPMTERPTLRYFLLMLEQLTRLRCLTLDRAFPIDVDIVQGDHDPSNQSSPTSLKPISLPLLESVTLVGSVSEIANTLRFMVLPRSARLVGTICDLSGLQKNVWRLTEALAMLYCDEESFSLDALALMGSHPSPRFTARSTLDPDFRQSFRIRGFRADSSRNRQECDGAAIDLTIEPDSRSEYSGIRTASATNLQSHPESTVSCSDAAIIITLNAIWKALSLYRVKTLVLHDVDVITQKTWSDFLRSLPSLKVLHITGRAPLGLVWALLLNAMSPASSSSASLSRTTSASNPDKALSLARSAARRCDRGGNAIVKDLKDIYLHNVDCSSGGFMVAPGTNASIPPINSYSDMDDSRFIDVLTAALRYRQLSFGGGGGGSGSAKLPLRSVSILRRCSYVPKDAVENLRNAVPGLNVVCEFGRDALIRNEEDVIDGARYWGRWLLEGDCGGDWKPRHYHRLKTLVGLDSKFARSQ
ncbi:hypothetical protein CVT26_000989 [Gymnopilus dilepis]|uniref:Uncharacterized protein n=1 Tax=Gymnopilus dilepis TaxID=231916 RepID=A0A409YL63_9AGAR|nr:hypothetical protein CVT26_000989 [Gymnopilus dilepis]